MNAVTQPVEHMGTHATASNATTNRQEATLLPPVDVVEDISGITLYADLPGVSREQLHLRVEGDRLDIEADMALPTPTGLQASHAEVTLARWHRSFGLSKELDAGQISADLHQGVLRVRIPKAAHAQPRKITVQVQ
ncbi:Hsp20/alpha crystallin family protein [Sphaerotilus sp.]|uniref:Hsp20/alpha crystallin family protein n=1 Tax=Sphaerotilus sp. TaxID=2093942 RepID=UPI0034E28FC1